jgi:hypothetical protein
MSSGRWYRRQQGQETKGGSRKITGARRRVALAAQRGRRRPCMNVAAPRSGHRGRKRARHRAPGGEDQEGPGQLRRGGVACVQQGLGDVLVEEQEGAMAAVRDLGTWGLGTRRAGTRGGRHTAGAQRRLCRDERRRRMRGAAGWTWRDRPCEQMVVRWQGKQEQRRCSLGYARIYRACRSRRSGEN